MKEQNKKGATFNRSNGLIVLYLISIYFAAILLYPGIEGVFRGDPPQEWAAEVILGTLIVGTIIAIEIFSSLEKTSPSKTGFVMFDWLMLLICGIYILIGGLLYIFGFYYRGLDGKGVLLFALLGLIGVLGLLHKMVRFGK